MQLMLLHIESDANADSGRVARILEQQRGAQAAARAGRNDRIALAGRLQALCRRQQQSHACRREGIAEISVPRTLVPVAEVPVLGTGKVDYVKVRALAEDSAA